MATVTALMKAETTIAIGNVDGINGSYIPR